jgi:hypothetical protein
MLQARWKGLHDLIIEGEPIAVRNDVLIVHGKHRNGKYMVKGLRSELYFWADEQEIELLGDEPASIVG